MSNQIKELLQKIRTLSAKQSAVIGICGLPGSGKTTLSRFLAPEFSDAVVVSADDFCILPTSLRKSFLSQALQENDAERLRYLAKPTHAADNPYANPLSWYDWQALAECLRRIKSGQEVRRPNAWNQQTGECDKLVIYPPLKKSVCFVDAIYLFEPALLGLIDFKVMIELAPEQAAQQEAQRDSHRSDPNYLAYKRIVTNLYCETYLKRYRAEMDLVIEGGALRESLSRPFTTP